MGSKLTYIDWRASNSIERCSNDVQDGCEFSQGDLGLFKGNLLDQSHKSDDFKSSIDANDGLWAGCLCLFTLLKFNIINLILEFAFKSNQGFNFNGDLMKFNVDYVDWLINFNEIPLLLA